MVFKPISVSVFISRLFFSVKTEVFDLHMVLPSCWKDVVKFKNIGFIFGGGLPKGLISGPVQHAGLALVQGGTQEVAAEKEAAHIDEFLEFRQGGVNGQSALLCCWARVGRVLRASKRQMKGAIPSVAVAAAS